jgi:hypothetical protein
MTDLRSPFKYGQRVIIDGDKTLVATVTGLMWYTEDHHEVQASYMHNGVTYSPWIDAVRVSPLSEI